MSFGCLLSTGWGRRLVDVSVRAVDYGVFLVSL